MSIPAPCCIACIPTRAASHIARQGITISRNISADNAQANSCRALCHPQIIQHELTYRLLLNHDTNALTPFFSNAIELVHVKQLNAHSCAHESASALLQTEAVLSWSKQWARHDPTNLNAI